MKKILLCGHTDVNCYFIEKDKSCYIVDPGYEKEKILLYINSHELKVLGILLTHGHIDHIGAIDCVDVPIYIHKDDYGVLVDNQKNGSDFLNDKITFDFKGLKIVVFDEKMKFQLNDKFVEVIHTPGHTIGSVCYLFGKDLYSGDTLFNAGVGRWDFPTGNLEMLQSSIVAIVDAMDEDVLVHPGHGEGSSIKDEKINNDYYREWKKCR